MCVNPCMQSLRRPLGARQPLDLAQQTISGGYDGDSSGMLSGEAGQLLGDSGGRQGLRWRLAVHLLEGLLSYDEDVFTQFLAKRRRWRISMRNSRGEVTGTETPRMKTQRPHYAPWGMCGSYSTTSAESQQGGSTGTSRHTAATPTLPLRARTILLALHTKIHQSLGPGSSKQTTDSQSEGSQQQNSRYVPRLQYMQRSPHLCLLHVPFYHTQVRMPCDVLLHKHAIRV